MSYRLDDPESHTPRLSCCDEPLIRLKLPYPVLVVLGALAFLGLGSLAGCAAKPHTQHPNPRLHNLGAEPAAPRGVGATI